ncbi:hypothetical protein V6N13_110071 [Hibiscus sabdariffa]
MCPCFSRVSQPGPLGLPVGFLTAKAFPFGRPSKGSDARRLFSAGDNFCRWCGVVCLIGFWLLFVLGYCLPVSLRGFGLPIVLRFAYPFFLGLF